MLRTWDLSMQHTYLQRTAQVVSTGTFAHADLSPDGQQVAYTWLDDQGKGWVRFVDTATGDATSPVRFPVWESDWFHRVDGWHPDGDRYAGHQCDDFDCATPGTVTVVDSTTGERVHKEVIGGEIYSLAYVDGGRSLLAGTLLDGADANTMTILDAETLTSRSEPFEVTPVCCTTPLGDGGTAMVYQYTGDGTYTHWQVVGIADGAVLSQGDLELSVQASAASPDGVTVAVTGDTGQVVTIDVSTGEQRTSTDLGAITVLWLEYSDDGELLVSGAEDGGVSLWDATTLDLLGTVYPPHRGEAVPAGAHFIGDSHDVAIASYDGSIYRWETGLGRALDFACQMAGRDLTEKEWEQYLPAQPYQSVCPDQ
jgi:WD40 repeat protein